MLPFEIKVVPIRTTMRTVVARIAKVNNARRTFQTFQWVETGHDGKHIDGKEMMETTQWVRFE